MIITLKVQRRLEFLLPTVLFACFYLISAPVRVSFFNSIAYSSILIVGAAVFSFVFNGNYRMKALYAAVYGYAISLVAYLVMLVFFDVKRSGPTGLIEAVGAARVFRTQLAFPLLSFAVLLLPLATIVAAQLTKLVARSKEH